jgi:hypothetical protein
VYMLEKYLRIKFIVFIWTKYEKKSGWSWLPLYGTNDDVG